MDKKDEHLNLLLIKLENLLTRQQNFEAEIKALKEEVARLRSGDESILPQQEKPLVRASYPHPQQQYPPIPFPNKPQKSFTQQFNRANIGKSDFEKFIGENLISKLGILILIIGVGIGAKLAIDQGWITPLTRIVLGYAVGAGLMIFALKLKSKYESYSAVLLSGAMSILYFITYAAYAYYQLIAQGPSFILMLVFTAFAVFAAIRYNRQVIAHIGLVGAYAVPFLLSNDTGNVAILFSYIAIINAGILALGFIKYWKWLFFNSFVITWLIFFGWNIGVSDQLGSVKISLLFATLYFCLFYATNLAYKVGKKEAFGTLDVVLLLANSFIFFGVGYFNLNLSASGKELLGLFTLGNAIVHFLVCLLVAKRKLADKNLFYFILALMITFVTIAVPVQLSGNWVSIFWAIEAAILYYFGRAKHIEIYEKLSLPLIILAFGSLVQDWAEQSFNYGFWSDLDSKKAITPFLNVGFLTSILCIGAFAFMLKVNKNAAKKEGTVRKSMVINLLSYCIPSFLIFITYWTFRQEISLVFIKLYQESRTKIGTGKFDFIYNENYRNLYTAVAYSYTLLFAAILTAINLKIVKSRTLAIANVVINLLVILTFLTHGLLILSELRDAYLLGDKNYDFGSLNIYIRYISFAFFALLINVCDQLSKSPMFKAKFKTAFDYLLYISIVWVLSSELLNILELNGLKSGYKLGLSILWGAYALLMISLGLWKKKKYLRIGAIALFALTLLKLFLYDLTALDTLAKTVVFVSLGVLLLIISFLYNKYKDLITDHEERP
ncbi:MAG: DUF2339 domain-containing protein [Pedobacter sp.]|nr:DUF2339 domain-containing protein [Pedobacter sp.]MDQ8053397.1 DUF2339 domain-containing protein [Pedobacter sp.]